MSYSIEILKDLSIMKQSKSMGTRFTTSLEDDKDIYLHDKNTNLVFKISIVKDKRSNDKYFIKTDQFDKKKFIANGEPQMIFFNPIVIVKIGATTKTKGNLYFTVDDNIDIYE